MLKIDKVVNLILSNFEMLRTLQKHDCFFIFGPFVFSWFEVPFKDQTEGLEEVARLEGQNCYPRDW